MTKFPHLIRHCSLAIIILFVISCAGSSNKNDLKKDNLETFINVSIKGMEQPVSINHNEQIWVVFQDQKDNYWFGSNGKGVFFYDHKNLIQYSTADGLVDNTIRDIQEDPWGNILIGTPEGVSKYDGSTFKTLKIISSSNNKWQLLPTDLWFNCNGKAEDVYRYDGEQLYELTLPRKDLNKTFGREVRGLSFKDMSHSPYSVFGIDKDKQGNLWIGTVVAGAYRYDGNSFLWIPELELSTLPDGRVPGVRSMIEDQDGYIWLSNFISKYQIHETGETAGYSKLLAIDTSANGPLKNQLPYFNSGLTDRNGDLWMTTYSGNVWKYDGKNLHNYPVKYGKTDVLIVSIYEDNQGNLWLGTDNAGIYKYNGQSFEKFQPVKSKL